MARTVSDTGCEFTEDEGPLRNLLTIKMTKKERLGGR